MDMGSGKTLAELDVKAGDVVSWNNKIRYMIGGVRDNGLYYKEGSESYCNLSNKAEWHIVSRAPQPEPTPPRKMHPDDFMLAISEFAEDNGFGVTQLEFYGTEFIGASLPRHSYSV
jgi:hypothetical protein